MLGELACETPSLHEEDRLYVVDRLTVKVASVEQVCYLQKRHDSRRVNETKIIS